jgi:hypothetical protein
LSGGIILPGILYLIQKQYVDLVFDEAKLKNLEKAKMSLDLKAVETVNKKK